MTTGAWAGGRALAAAISLFLCAATAGATSFVMVPDDSLADQAAAIALVEVVAVYPGPATGRPATDYLVEIARLVKGDLPGSRIVVRVPGGLGADGVGLRIWGAPRFRPGDAALLFLEPGPEGDWQILHLMLGAFHPVSDGNRLLAVRDLSEATELARAGEELAADGPRDLERFVEWLAARAAREEIAAAYRVEGHAPARLGAAHSSLTAADGLPVRWFDFGRRAAWRVEGAGQPGLGAEHSVHCFQGALEAWNADPTSDIELAFQGTGGAGRGLAGADGVSGVLFGDPTRAQVPGTYDCKTGGVVAIGGPYFYEGTREHRGRRYHEAFEAEVVTNDGAECFFLDNPRGAEEVFAHELGHALGLGHSSERQALMWPKAHDDGRGARLHDDDRAAVSILYGDGTFTGGGPPAPSTPVAGLELSVETVSAKQVRLGWRHGVDAVASFVVEVKAGKTFRALATLPPSATGTLVEGLAPGKRYQLRVRALRAAAPPVASNVVAVKTLRAGR